MAARPQTKLSQAEMLERLTAAPFKQTRAVPKEAVVERSPEARWWRSDSPDREGLPDGTRAFEGERAARPLHSSTAAGCGTSAHYQDREESKLIVGYSGHIPGKLSGNVLAGNFSQTVAESQEYVKTSRANRLGEGSVAKP